MPLACFGSFYRRISNMPKACPYDLCVIWVKKITDLIHFLSDFHLLFGDDWILMD